MHFIPKDQIDFCECFWLFGVCFLFFSLQLREIAVLSSHVAVKVVLCAAVLLDIRWRCFSGLNVCCSLSYRRVSVPLL